MQDQGRGLKELLQDLMNRSVTKADNPWLHLTTQVNMLWMHRFRCMLLILVLPADLI